MTKAALEAHGARRTVYKVHGYLPQRIVTDHNPITLTLTLTVLL